MKFEIFGMIMNNIGLCDSETSSWTFETREIGIRKQRSEKFLYVHIFVDITAIGLN
jgi:hypothetical protein